MKCTLIILFSLSWMLCGILAFRIFMRDMINKKYYTYEPEDSLILFGFTVGGYITLLSALLLLLSKAQICRKTIEKIVGNDIIKNEEDD